MKTSVVRTVRIWHASREERWRAAALLLAVAIAAHYLSMSSPALHDRMMAMPVAVMEHHDGGAGTDGSPSPAPCICSCPMIEAIVPLIDASPLMLLALVMAVGAALPMPLGKVPRLVWRWPQTRHRAFLQVFLC